MFQGNWKCSSCGGAITELPFQPRSESGLTCRSCYSKNKGGGAKPIAKQPAQEVPDIPFDADVASGPDDRDAFPEGSASSGEKPKFAGNWQCANCGAAITSLPFTPRDTSNLKCIDCFKRSKS